MEKRDEEIATLLWWSFQQIPCWVGAGKGFWSLKDKASPLPSLAWLETGNYSFIFLITLLTEKCSFDWTEIIYKAHLSAANVGKSEQKVSKSESWVSNKKVNLF